MALPAEQLPHQLHVSDRQLRDLSFRHHDPENSIHGLKRGRPDQNRAIEVVGHYDETPPGGRKAKPAVAFVWCCHCGKPTHWKGYVIRDEAGETYIIGAQNCGRDHYGVYFEDAETRFKNRQRRQQALMQWDIAAARAPALRDAVEALLRSDGLAALELLRGEVRRASKECAALLARHVRTETRLVVRHKERDHDAERARLEKYELAVRAFQLLPPALRRERCADGLEPQLDDSPIVKAWTEDLGFLKGGDFLIEEEDVRSAALALRQAVVDLLALVAQGTEGVPTSVLTRQVRAIADRASDLFQRGIRLSFFELFFAPANVDRLVRWAANQDQFSIAPANRGITVQSGLSHPRLIVPPSASDLPDFDPFENVAREIEPA